MVMLEHEPTGGHETETAIGRFFNILDIEAVALQEQITAIVEGADSVPAMLKHIAKRDVGDQLWGVSRRLEEVLSGQIGPERTGGLVVTGGLSRQLERIDEYRRPLNKECETRPVYQIPGSRITALQVNPGYYGNLGHIRPVVNLRIQNNEDWSATLTAHAEPKSWNDLIMLERERTSLSSDGRWHQFAIGTGVIRLADGS